MTRLIEFYRRQSDFEDRANYVVASLPATVVRKGRLQQFCRAAGLAEDLQQFQRVRKKAAGPRKNRVALRYSQNAH